MSDNELLLALSEMMDTKLSAKLQPMKKDINDIKNEVKKLISYRRMKSGQILSY